MHAYIYQLRIGLRFVIITDSMEKVSNISLNPWTVPKPNPNLECEVMASETRTARVPSKPLIDGAERVTSLRVLGVLLDSKLTISDHISQILSACSSSIFALRLLRNHGLRSDQLHLVARATTIASIMYAT